jgi:hypothetical protein
MPQTNRCISSSWATTHLRRHSRGGAPSRTTETWTCFSWGRMLPSRPRFTMSTLATHSGSVPVRTKPSTRDDHPWQLTGMLCRATVLWEAGTCRPHGLHSGRQQAEVALDGSGLLAQSSPYEGSVSRWSVSRSKQGLLLASTAYCSQAAAQRASLLQTRQGELVNEVSYFTVELPGERVGTSCTKRSCG